MPTDRDATDPVPIRSFPNPPGDDIRWKPGAGSGGFLKNILILLTVSSLENLYIAGGWGLGYGKNNCKSPIGSLCMTILPRSCLLIFNFGLKIAFQQISDIINHKKNLFEVRLLYERDYSVLCDKQQK